MIKPAINTLQALDGEQFLDKLAVHIHDASCAVKQLGKPASITVKITFDMLSEKGMTNPVMTAEAEIMSKLPKPQGNLALFYFDENDNPTTEQTRQPSLGLTIAGSTDQQQGAA